MSPGLPQIHVIMTTFNRRAVTLTALQTLSSQIGHETLFVLRAYIVDDGSTDGTPDAVEAAFPGFASVISSEGDLFWARGMSRAQVLATQTNEPDFLLWLNDDVALCPDTVGELLDCAARHPHAIVVGATEFDGEVTYSGAVLRSKRPTSLMPVKPNGHDQPVDTFNGNIVLVPSSAYRALGGVDPGYEHAYGDIDYGLRAQRLGIPVVMVRRTVGRCSRNSVSGTWKDTTLSRRTRTSLLFSRKGVPPRSHFRYNIAHSNVLVGTGYAVATYLRAFGAIWVKTPPRDAAQEQA